MVEVAFVSYSFIFSLPKLVLKVMGEEVLDRENTRGCGWLATLSQDIRM